MITNSSYYVILNDDKRSVLFYDSNGNELCRDTFNDDELVITLVGKRPILSISRMDDVLDPECITKFRPAEMEIWNCVKRGRLLSFYDKEYREISFEYYDGKGTIDDVCNFLKQLPGNVCQIDVEWLMKNDIPIRNNDKAKCSIL